MFKTKRGYEIFCGLKSGLPEPTSKLRSKTVSNLLKESQTHVFTATKSFKRFCFCLSGCAKISKTALLPWFDSKKGFGGPGLRKNFGSLRVRVPNPNLLFPDCFIP